MSDETLALPGDALREGVVATLREELGDALLDSLVKPDRKSTRLNSSHT